MNDPGGINGPGGMNDPGGINGPGGMNGPGGINGPGGMNARIKLIDFASAMNAGNTIQILLLGTEVYRPPELWGIHRTTKSFEDIKAYDLWATGLVLARLVNLMLCYDRHVAEDNHSMDENVESLDAFVNEFITKIMDIHKRHRIPPLAFVQMNAILQHMFTDYQFNLFDLNPFIRPHRPSMMMAPTTMTTGLSHPYPPRSRPPAVVAGMVETIGKPPHQDRRYSAPLRQRPPANSSSHHRPRAGGTLADLKKVAGQQRDRI